MRRLIALLLLAATPAAADQCPVERATYHLKGAPAGTTLRFPKAARPNAWSRLEAVLHSGATGRTYRFSYTVSNGYATQYLVQESPPPAGGENSASAVYFFTDALRGTDLPRPGEAAPRYVFLPDLGKSLYYGSVGADPRAKREVLPTELWELAACR